MQGDTRSIAILAAVVAGGLTGAAALCCCLAGGCARLGRAMQDMFAYERRCRRDMRAGRYDDDAVEAGGAGERPLPPNASVVDNRLFDRGS